MWTKLTLATWGFMTLLQRAPVEVDIRRQLKDLGKTVSLEDMALNSVVEASESNSVTR